MADQTFTLNRKLTDGFLVIKTSDDGDTWTTPSFTTDTVNNTVTFDFDPTTDVALFHYETLSDFTEPDDNRAVVGELGDVTYSMDYRVDRGNRLFPTLLNDVATSSYGQSQYVPVTNYALWSGSGGLYDWDGQPTTHNPLNLAAPINNSDAVKALPHLVEKNGQLFLQWHAVQLKYKSDAPAGKDKWGDTVPATSLTNAYGVVGVVGIVDNESTKTDLNGQTVKVVTHTSMFPIGWA